VQAYRGKIRACEMIDSNSVAYLPVEKRLGKNQDIIFLEIVKKNFDEVYEKLLSQLIYSRRKYI
jgi:hypothetical protein